MGTDGACPSGPRASGPAPPLRRLEFKATALTWVPAPPFSLPLGVDLPPLVWGMEHEVLVGRGGAQAWLEASAQGLHPWTSILGGIAAPGSLGPKDHQSNCTWSQEKGKRWGAGLQEAQEMVVASWPELSEIRERVRGLSLPWAWRPAHSRCVVSACRFR